MAIVRLLVHVVMLRSVVARHGDASISRLGRRARRGVSSPVAWFRDCFSAQCKSCECQVCAQYPPPPSLRTPRTHPSPPSSLHPPRSSLLAPPSCLFLLTHRDDNDHNLGCPPNLLLSPSCRSLLRRKGTNRSLTGTLLPRNPDLDENRHSFW